MYDCWCVCVCMRICVLGVCVFVFVAVGVEQKVLRYVFAACNFATTYVT